MTGAGASYNGTVSIVKAGTVGEMTLNFNNIGMSFPQWQSTKVADWPNDLPLPHLVGASSSDLTRGAGGGLTLNVNTGTREISVYARDNAPVSINQATVRCALYWNQQGE